MKSLSSQCHGHGVHRGVRVRHRAAEPVSRWKRRCLLVSLLCLQLLPQVLPAQITDSAIDEVRSRKLEVSEADTDRVLQFDLDASIFRRLNDSMSNLAVFQAGGTIVPSVIEAARENREVIERSERPATLEKVEEVDGQLRLEIAVPELANANSESLSALRINTSAVDFDKNVMIEAAETDGTWKMLLSDGLIFDWTRFVDLSRYEVAFPPTQSRRLRVTFSGATEERRARVREWIGQRVGDQVVAEWERVTIETRPFRIDGVTLVFERRVPREGESLLRDVEVKTWQATKEATKKETWIEWEVGRQPISEIDLTFEQRNFGRDIEVLVQNPVPLGSVPTWTTIKQDRISAIDLPEIAERRTRIQFPACRPQLMRVVIQDEGSPPLSLTALSARGPAYRGYALAERGKAQFELRYGGDPPQSAAEQDLIARVRRQVEPQPVTLGPEVAWEEIGSEPEWAKILVWIALAMALIVLSAGLILALRRSGLDRSEVE